MSGLRFRQQTMKTNGWTKLAAIIVTAWLWPAPHALADSVASKNKTANRLYEQGRYADAEKTYLEAQAEMPGRPELSYNLGNAFIRQKKYDQALQSLRQSIARGSRGMQVNGWYNIGNALFDMGNYKDSAQAYIQALRLNPADRDAKHNLELAQKKLQEQQQQQQQSQGNRQDQNQQKPEGSQNEGRGSNAPKPQDKQDQQSQDPQGQKPANPQASQSDRPQGGFSKERALQILDALQNQELAAQRRLLERQVRRKTTVRDW
jgi:Ca-activated chloride channel family protein